MAKIRWRLLFGLASLGAAVILTFPAGAARQLSNAAAVHERGFGSVGGVDRRGIASAFYGLAAVAPRKLKVHHRFPRHGQSES